jgi:hypothetical protein
VSNKNGIRYTDEQKTEFVAYAAQVGVPLARQALGYPLVAQSAYDWMKAAGVEIPRSPLQVHAAHINSWYGDVERRLVTQQVLDEAHRMLLDGIAEPKELASVAQAVRSAVATLQVLDGKASEIVENPADRAPEIVALIEEYRARNDAEIRKLRAV